MVSSPWSPTRLSSCQMCFIPGTVGATLTLTVPFLSILPVWISTRRGDGGAWQRLERGEIQLWDFYVAFGQELSDTVLGNVWYREYCARKGIGESMLLVPRCSVPFYQCLVNFYAHDPKNAIPTERSLPRPSHRLYLRLSKITRQAGN